MGKGVCVIRVSRYDPLDPGGANNAMCDAAGKFFTVLFTLEMFVKMVDQVPPAACYK
eukprot:COSAG05_NODE_2340_length_3209_cov_18.437727_3_plen_57_part_00